MQQKVIQIGNSIGVIIPQSLANNSLEPGDIVHIEKDPLNDTYVINKKNTGSATVTPEFFAWLNKFNKKYKNALKDLSEK